MSSVTTAAAVTSPGTRMIWHSTVVLGGLQRLADEIQKLGAAQYLKHRTAIALLHRCLNEREYVAPAFRPLVRREWFRVDPVGDQIFRDQIVVDMHWAYCRNRRGISAEARAICADGFDFAKAEAFAANSHRMEGKAAAFGLLPEERLQSIWLVDATVRRKRNALLTKRPRHKARLTSRRDAVSTPRAERRSLKRIDIEKVCNTWLAREIASLAVASGNPSFAEIAYFRWIITADASSTPHSVRHQLRQVERHID